MVKISSIINERIRWRCRYRPRRRQDKVMAKRKIKRKRKQRLEKLIHIERIWREYFLEIYVYFEKNKTKCVSRYFFSFEMANSILKNKDVRPWYVMELFSRIVNWKSEAKLREALCTYPSKAVNILFSMVIQISLTIN